MTAQSQASLSKIFLAFARIGLLGFGGGPAMIPLVRDEVVTRHQWMDDDAFADVLAIANTLPGPIATKMPGYIGYRIGGFSGCAVAVAAVIVPMVLAMILLLGLFSRYREVEWIQGMGFAVIPVVMIMMGQLTLDFWNKSRLALGPWTSLVLGAGSGVLIYLLGIHPGWIIGALLATAMLAPEPRRKEVDQ
uniref:chromate transporter n=1 Tax=Halomonas sp. TaxID=1486246 RepID=UPI00260DFF1B|nr:chromate transporter [Halomonas sp.]